MLSGKQEGLAMRAKLVFSPLIDGFEEKINQALQSLPANAEVVDIKLSTAMAHQSREIYKLADTMLTALILWREKNA
jgi:hypothetical protein